ncbi:MAG TPA: glycosyltransferase [Vicinamibacterales bacterium]|nr:glycosyltransferase [Vicinamibacterales bacterium]
MIGPALTVGITTRNRPGALQRCLASLRHIAHLDPEVLVFDDASTPPAAGGNSGVRLIRDDEGAGYIAGRNRLVREAAAPLILLLDDDAALVEARGVERAMQILLADVQVAAVAFAQADGDGLPWAGRMQPGTGHSPSYVPAFIGFAHMLRRDTFLTLGGYRERYVFYGEEKDFCLRLLDAGHRVVYLPDARVVHRPEMDGRDRRRYLRYVTRNDCLHALCNEPVHRLLWMLPARLALYFRMRRRWRIEDPYGWAWILNELCANARGALRERRAVSPATIRLWSDLRRVPHPYPLAVSPQTVGSWELEVGS